MTQTFYERVVEQKTVTDVRLLTLPRFLDPNGELVVFEDQSGLPFDVKRVFSVSATEGDIRGEHAHKKCGQVLWCPLGAIDVTCDDGQAKRTFRLDHSTFALFLPATIWARQLYREKNSVLVVLCDMPFQEADYIRDYDTFMEWRKELVAQ